MWLPGSLAPWPVTKDLDSWALTTAGSSPTARLRPPQSLFKGKASTGIIHLQKRPDLAVICRGACEYLTPIAGHSRPPHPRPPRRVCQSSTRWTIN